MDFFALACTLEEKGYQYYREVAKNVQPEPIAEIFRALAREEKKHYLVFEALGSNQPVHTASDSNPEAETIFRSLVENRITVIKSEFNYTEALDIALDLERKSIATYQDFRADTKKKTDGAILSQIIDEEKKHLWFLTSLKKHYIDPEEWFQNPDWYSA